MRGWRNAAAGVALCAAAGLATACGGSGGGAQPRSAAAADPLGCGHSPVTPAGGYPLGEQTVTVVDHSRGTPAAPARHLAAQPDRTLRVSVVYPAAAGPAGQAPRASAAAAAGAFPLVVAAHGVLSSGPGMIAKTVAWARAGYVVAAPTFPLSSGLGANIDDLPRQPGDLAFVVRSLRALVTSRASVLHGHVATDCLALAGHSLGAATVLEATYERGFEVPGLRAAISMSGILAPLPPGSFRQAPRTPVLLVHGDRDTVVPISGSRDAFATLPGPRWFLTMRGADHNSYFAPPYSGLLDTAAVAFLDAELKGRPAAVRALPRTVAAAGVGTLATAGAGTPAVHG